MINWGSRSEMTCFQTSVSATMSNFPVTSPSLLVTSPPRGSRPNTCSRSSLRCVDERVPGSNVINWGSRSEMTCFQTSVSATMSNFPVTSPSLLVTFPQRGSRPNTCSRSSLRGLGERVAAVSLCRIKVFIWKRTCSRVFNSATMSKFPNAFIINLTPSQRM